MRPRLIARAKTGEKKIWMFGEGPDATAVIAIAEPKQDEYKRPLAAVLAHLDSREWIGVTDQEAELPVE